MTITSAENREMEERPEEGMEVDDRKQLYSPRSDVYETNEAVVVVAEMPGAKESDINITERWMTRRRRGTVSGTVSTRPEITSAVSPCHRTSIANTSTPP